jgi:hypothetical protein
MKKASVILSHLANQPQFKLLKRQKCYRRFLSLLTPKWQKAIAFVYVRQETLFIAVRHPGFKMELHYNRDLLKTLLTELASRDRSCAMLQAEKVVIFHSRYHHPADSDRNREETVPHYHELSDSSFVIQSSDPEITARFETTRTLIRCSQ